ncbi:MAG: hypothetical protein QXV83_00310 [Candidatus Anstonellaceae archaeon]
MQKTFLFIFLFVFFSFIHLTFCPPVEQQNFVLNAFLEVLEKSNIIIKNFSLSQTKIYIDSQEPVEFYIQIQNIGNKIETISSKIDIYYYYNHSYVKTIEIENSSLIGGEEEIKVVNFEYGDLQEAKYSATLTITYGGTTKNSTIDFEAVRRQQQNIQREEVSGGSGGGEIKVRYSPTVPKIEQKSTIFTQGIGLLKNTYFSQVYQNERGYFILTIENQNLEEKIIKIKYPQTDEFIFSGPKEIVVEPKSNLTILVGFEPKEAKKEGYYVFDIGLEVENSSTIQTYAINLLKAEQKPILIKRNIVIDRATNQTIVYLELKNQLNTKISYLEIYERVPTKLFEKIEQGGYSGKNSVFPATLWFGIKDIYPQESQIISYKINTLLSDLEDCTKFSVMQVSIYQPSQKTSIYSSLEKIIFSQTKNLIFREAGSQTLTFELLNNDLKQKLIEITIKLPTGWTTNNPKLKIFLEPRKKTTLEVLIFSPQKLETGQYIGNIEISSEDEKKEKEFVINVESGLSGQQVIQYIYIQKPLELYLEEIKEKIVIMKDAIFFLTTISLFVLIYIILHKKQKETEFAAISYSELEKLKESIKREIRLP